MDLSEAYTDGLFAHLRARGVEVAAGLSPVEMSAAQQHHRLAFPPDLRFVLSRGLPVSKGFPNWRVLDSPLLESQLTWPVDSICFDVEHASFWAPDWGQRPLDLASALASAREHLQRIPPLVPIYAHRYLPTEPPESGNPVFSVYQTDVIYYGFDLATYFEAEFRYPNALTAPTGPKDIPFWSDLAEGRLE